MICFKTTSSPKRNRKSKLWRDSPCTFQLSSHLFWPAQRGTVIGVAAFSYVGYESSNSIHVSLVEQERSEDRNINSGRDSTMQQHSSDGCTDWLWRTCSLPIFGLGNMSTMENVKQVCHMRQSHDLWCFLSFAPCSAPLDMINTRCQSWSGWWQLFSRLAVFTGYQSHLAPCSVNGWRASLTTKPA